MISSNIVFEMHGDKHQEESATDILRKSGFTLHNNQKKSRLQTTFVYKKSEKTGVVRTKLAYSNSLAIGYDGCLAS